MEILGKIKTLQDAHTKVHTHNVKFNVGRSSSSFRDPNDGHRNLDSLYIHFFFSNLPAALIYIIIQTF